MGNDSSMIQESFEEKIEELENKERKLLKTICLLEKEIENRKKEEEARLKQIAGLEEELEKRNKQDEARRIQREKDRKQYVQRKRKREIEAADVIRIKKCMREVRDERRHQGHY